MTGRLVEATFAAGWALVKALPERLTGALFTGFADVTWWRRGRGVRQLEANLARVAPGSDLRALSRAGMRSYLRYWLEVFRLPVLPADRIVAQFRLADEALLREAVAAGRGVVVALPHMGNWDHAGAWASLTGIPFTTVAERLEPEALYTRFVAFREGLGMEVLPLGSGGQLFGQLAQRLRRGAVLCLLADRDLTPGGVEVRFFGEPARMPGGPAGLALTTGAALLPTTLWYDPNGRGWCGRIHPAVGVPRGGDRREKVAAMTQAMADAFAEDIAAHPADWHMLQRMWVADRAPVHSPQPVPEAAA